MNQSRTEAARLNRGLIDWRAGCGKAACPVRREGGRPEKPVPLPLSIREFGSYRVQLFITTHQASARRQSSLPSRLKKSHSPISPYTVSGMVFRLLFVIPNALYFLTISWVTISAAGV